MKKVTSLLICALILAALCMGIAGCGDAGSQDALADHEEALAKKTETVDTLEKIASITDAELPGYGDFAPDVTPKYSKDEWMNENGEIMYPYRGHEDEISKLFIYEKLPFYCIPNEVLEKMTSKQLFVVVCDWMSETLVTPEFHTSRFPGFLTECLYNCQAANELVHRKNMAEVLYRDYLERDYIDTTEAKGEALTNYKLISFEESVLASDLAYGMLDDDMKKTILAEAVEKANDIEYVKNMGISHSSVFYNCIMHQSLTGKSGWYDYIKENGSDEARELLKRLVDDESITWTN